MHRTTFAVVGVFGASTLLLVDSAIKGTALLGLAALATLFLRRDSAATRHLVWLMAMVALLAAPVLSVLLPQWRVLPEWVGVSAEPVMVATSSPPIARAGDDAVALPQTHDPADVERPSATTYQPAAVQADSRPTLAAAETAPESAIGSWNWSNGLPFVWAMGFSVFMLRLLAARWLLEKRGRESFARLPEEGDQQRLPTPFLAALQAACLQLGICRPVTLLIHPDKTIPVVWGIFRCRLLLPAAARHWSGEQLRSVLLHELAHLKRRDLLAQLLTQIACAMHWFNPLVWLAAWRLGVERERACDDLVLSCGVRPSAYAGHLLDVVTELSPACQTQACGLAMARKSSLEGRLVAVLGRNLNRRGVSAAFAAIALAIAAGIAVPLAMLRAANEQPAAATPQEAQQPKDAMMLKAGTEDRLKGGDKGGAAPAGNAQPKNKEAQMLFKMWQVNARGNGDIPGGLVGRLGDKVKEFIHNNTGDKSGDPYAKKMAPLVPRLDATRDWKPAEAAALLDDIAAIHTIPLQTTMEDAAAFTFKKGAALPPQLADAPWGKAEPSGLRVAWLLEPRAAEHRLGTPLKSRILVHNEGKNAVVFRIRTWHQSSEHKAHDVKGADIKIDSVYWTTLGWLAPFRLAPGEFIEVIAAGIGVGANKNDEDWQNTRVGSWIAANPGDEVTITPAPVQVSDWNEKPQPGGDAKWWLNFINTRLSWELPLPSAAAERTRLLDRAVRDLFGSAPTAEETATFVADGDKNALDALAKRLAKRSGTTPFTGSLTSGPTKFRVLPPDPDAAKKPRTANNPGRYTLGDTVRLVVWRRPDGARIVNEASIEFYAQDPTKPAPGKPHEIKLPDGYGTWAAAWERGSTVLWVVQKDAIRSYDFTDPAQVKETTLKIPANLDQVPRPILEALRNTVEVPGLPMQAPAPPKK